MENVNVAQGVGSSAEPVVASGMVGARINATKHLFFVVTGSIKNCLSHGASAVWCLYSDRSSVGGHLAGTVKSIGSIVCVVFLLPVILFAPSWVQGFVPFQQREAAGAGEGAERTARPDGEAEEAERAARPDGGAEEEVEWGWGGPDEGEGAA